MFFTFKNELKLDSKQMKHSRKLKIWVPKGGEFQNRAIESGEFQSRAIQKFLKENNIEKENNMLSIKNQRTSIAERFIGASK